MVHFVIGLYGVMKAKHIVSYCLRKVRQEKLLWLFLFSFQLYIKRDFVFSTL
uniref:Uncharacterized protein n=1 Tax=Manihot esculenta TaxID=3983 RepID=A0A199UCJ6_MANES